MDTFGIIVAIAVIVGVPAYVIESMRQRVLARKYRDQLEAWRAAQDRVQEAHERNSQTALALQRESHEEYIRSNERLLVMQEASLDERRRTNTILADLAAALRSDAGRDSGSNENP